MNRDHNDKRFDRIIFKIFARSGSAAVNSRISILNFYFCILDSAVSGWIFAGKTGKAEFF
jgi:hypothetical protein